MERGGRVVREGVEAAFDEHPDALGGQQAQEACPGEGAGGYEGVNLCVLWKPVTCELRGTCATTGNEKPDLVNDQRLGIASKCRKHAPAEVEEEYEGGAGDPYRSKHFEGVYPDHLVCKAYILKGERAVGSWCEVADLALVFKPPGL